MTDCKRCPVLARAVREAAEALRAGEVQVAAAILDRALRLVG